jgi:hypothetical protein
VAVTTTSISQASERVEKFYQQAQKDLLELVKSDEHKLSGEVKIVDDEELQLAPAVIIVEELTKAIRKFTDCLDFLPENNVMSADRPPGVAAEYLRGVLQVRQDVERTDCIAHNIEEFSCGSVESLQDSIFVTDEPTEAARFLDFTSAGADASPETVTVPDDENLAAVVLKDEAVLVAASYGEMKRNGSFQGSFAAGQLNSSPDADSNFQRSAGMDSRGSYPALDGTDVSQLHTDTDLRSNNSASDTACASKPHENADSRSAFLGFEKVLSASAIIRMQTDEPIVAPSVIDKASPKVLELVRMGPTNLFKHILSNVADVNVATKSKYLTVELFNALECLMGLAQQTKNILAAAANSRFFAEWAKRANSYCKCQIIVEKACRLLSRMCLDPDFGRDFTDLFIRSEGIAFTLKMIKVYMESCQPIRKYCTHLLGLTINYLYVPRNVPSFTDYDESERIVDAHPKFSRQLFAQLLSQLVANGIAGVLPKLVMMALNPEPDILLLSTLLMCTFI